MFQLGVLNVMSYLIERVGIAIRSICQDLVRHLLLLNPSYQDLNIATIMV